MSSKPTKTRPKLRPEIKTANSLYRWLWLSPFLTFPTLVILLFIFESSVLAVFASALWHLVLLRHALDKQSEFVRWHGRQALLLASVRTLVALPIPEGIINGGGFLFLLILIAVWLFGTPWGQGQAKRGECSLMRWTGVGDHLPIAVTEGVEGIIPQVPPEPKTTVDQLVDVIRFNPDPQLRSTALARLEELGHVEPL